MLRNTEWNFAASCSCMIKSIHMFCYPSTEYHSSKWFLPSPFWNSDTLVSLTINPCAHLFRSSQTELTFRTTYSPSASYNLLFTICTSPLFVSVLIERTAQAILLLIKTLEQWLLMKSKDLVDYRSNNNFHLTDLLYESVALKCSGIFSLFYISFHIDSEGMFNLY